MQLRIGVLLYCRLLPRTHYYKVFVWWCAASVCGSWRVKCWISSNSFMSILFICTKVMDSCQFNIQNILAKWTPSKSSRILCCVAGKSLLTFWGNILPWWLGLKSKPSKQQGYCFALIMEAVHSFENVYELLQATHCNITEDRALHSHHCENLKYCFIISYTVYDQLSMPVRGRNKIIKCMDNTCFRCVEEIAVLCEYKFIYMLMTLVIVIDCVPSNCRMSYELKRILN
jgi:hypothetical protein